MGQHLKRIYGVKINYRLMDDFLSDIGGMKQKKKRVGDPFVKRIMLAVTQVNGCEMCSYFHTKEALKMGMPEHEIRNILGGEFRDAPEEEAAALAFAQHYAETVGRPDAEAWDKLVQIYGQQKAEAILTFIRAIMVGNAQGNIMGAFKSRLKGKPEPNSTFFKEISVLFSTIFIVPFVLVKTGLQKLFVPSSRKPVAG